ncbi:hypothetical protein BDZ90DRAFT_276424 [Jaminaea rosea]|uniref:Uncharacterized protein n=1 Tax=Jaminaea rosea TaxID=1569628 RepID=A0A316UX65_9BASI|nr:hypothetical protein BDZ90DRAFT_276424 [Jaminaea rosea]PWN29907.1 hypothetical protein BDZ90DRAFT_276424 [Jaminaea rosea]
MASPPTSQAALLNAAATTSGSPLPKTSPSALSPFVGLPTASTSSSALTPSQQQQPAPHPAQGGPMTPFASASASSPAAAGAAGLTPMAQRMGNYTPQSQARRAGGARTGGAAARGQVKKTRSMQDDVETFQRELDELERLGEQFYDAVEGSLCETASPDAQAALEHLLSALSQTLASLSRSVLGGVAISATEGGSEAQTSLQDRIAALRAKGGASDDAYERRQRLVEASRAVAHVLSATTTTTTTTARPS